MDHLAFKGIRYYKPFFRSMATMFHGSILFWCGCKAFGSGQFFMCKRHHVINLKRKVNG